MCEGQFMKRSVCEGQFMKRSVCEGQLMKRSVCINPLITLFLVQRLHVNAENIVSTWRCGDRGILLGAT
jgi:hypothetical protein